jgi:Ser-tRNA(Ala) deacylase AlaX
MRNTAENGLPTETPRHDPRDAAGYRPQTGVAQPALARVVRAEDRELILTGSPLYPSRPSFAGDRGLVEGVGLLDVEEHRDGLLHVLDEALPVSVGQLVEVRPDRDRRNRIARTHTACVIVSALLAQRSVGIVSVEIAAGLAWIEVDRQVDLNLQDCVERDLPIVATPLSQSVIRVKYDGITVDTFNAPLASAAGALSGAEVRTVAALEGGITALEVALPDAQGRWWR